MKHSEAEMKHFEAKMKHSEAEMKHFEAKRKGRALPPPEGDFAGISP